MPHWRAIPLPGGGTGWVNLNATDVRKFSDADFPDWKGWRFVDDASDGDSRCDSALIRGWLDIDGDRTVSPAEAQTRLSQPQVARRLARTICKFPTDWDASTVDTRWGWLKTPSPENPKPFTATEFAGLKQHVGALAFWNAGIGLPAVHWHWEPREFVRVWRRCGWINAQDLARVYPTTPENVREQFRLAINSVLGRYGMRGQVRAAHFLGQGLVESMGLQLMVEGSVSFGRNPLHPSFQSEKGGFYAEPKDLYGYFHNYERLGNDLGNVSRSRLVDANGAMLTVSIGRDSSGRPIVTAPTPSQVDSARSSVGDGMKFRGRGFKQLTGLSNYAQYWVFRGWLTEGIDFDAAWWLPNRGHGVRPKKCPSIPDPQRICTSSFNCIDSGGQFAARNNVLQAADFGVTQTASEKVSKIINRWDKPSFGRRFNGTTSAYEILGP